MLLSYSVLHCLKWFLLLLGSDGRVCFLCVCVCVVSLFLHFCLSFIVDCQYIQWNCSAYGFWVSFISLSDLLSTVSLIAFSLCFPLSLSLSSRVVSCSCYCPFKQKKRTHNGENRKRKKRSFMPRETHLVCEAWLHRQLHTKSNPINYFSGYLMLVCVSFLTHSISSFINALPLFLMMVCFRLHQINELLSLVFIVSLNGRTHRTKEEEKLMKQN